MSYGITPAGFVIKPLAQIRADIESAQKASPAIGPSQDYSDDDALGQLNGIMSSQLAELWELGQLVFSSGDPDAALDFALVVIASLTGTTKRGAEASTSVLTVNLDPGVTVTAGARVSVSTRPDIVFTTDTDVTNGGGSAADFPVGSTCTETGPVAANAGTLTVIDAPVPGWNSAINAADALTGRNVDTEPQLRQRREDQLALRGGSTVNAIRADLLDFDAHPELEGVEFADVLENVTDTYDLEGLPPHSIEVLIDDGQSPSVADDDLAQVIFETKGAGIATHGTSSGNAIDSKGGVQVMRFSRVVRLPVYVTLSYTGTATAGDVKAAVVAKGNSFGVSGDVIALALRAAPLALSGVTDVPSLTLGFTVTPLGTSNLTIGTRERAAFDTSRVVIV